MTRRFAVRAATRDGSMMSLSIAAATRDAAARALVNRGLFPVTITEERLRSRRRRLAAQDAAMGLHGLGSMLGSGLPVASALRALETLAPRAWKEVVPELRDAVREGKSVSEALASTSLGLPKIALGIIQANEAAGDLAGGVQTAAAFAERRASTRRAVISALTYPALLLTAGGVSVLVLIGVVLPRFATILSDLGQPLPSSMRALLWLAAAVKGVAFPALILMVVAVVSWHAWMASPTSRESWDRLMLSLPIVGQFRMSAATARVDRKSVV